jgi:hypothetical protein
LAKRLPTVEEILRGSLVERYLTCGNPACKCARGQPHGPAWHLTVTLSPGRTTGGVVAAEQLDQVRRWIGNYRQVNEHLEEISSINCELLRPARRPARKE